ncbi:MAG TPA: glycoside hydrolase domain-containing protein [Puia sp.]|nr:glycoside hydrolase domain-containing protein [Puia sp.]
MQKRFFLFLISLTLCSLIKAQPLQYSTCPGCWNPDSLGNHRAVVRFDGPGPVAHVKIAWRRRDRDPAGHRIIVQDGRTGARINNVKALAITREAGELAFQPSSGKGTYYVYYLPYRNEGRSNYPKGVYWQPDMTASREWLAGIGKIPALNCRVAGIQSIDSFNSFYPMEVIATAAETRSLRAKHAAEPFLVFPEDRGHSIRMRDDLPYRWIKAGPRNTFEGEADRGEYYAYQLGVYALRPLEDVQVKFSALTSVTGKRIPAAASSCINTAGVSYDGRPFTKTVTVAEGKVQALWCGIDVPASTAPGIYSGTAVVSDGTGSTRKISIRLTVRDKLLADGGAGNPAAMTRLKWLNSTLAQENTVIAPYIPLKIQGDTLISLLGRSVKLSVQGFPEQIQTFFTPEMTDIGTTPNNLLAENIHFHFTRRSDGKDIRLKAQGVHFLEKSPGTAVWEASSAADELKMEVHGSLEFDGFMAYTVKVTALQDLDLKDIVMHIPFQKEAAVYMIGLGRKGGYRPDSMYHWKWDVAHKNQDGAWIGTVNEGLQYSLYDEHYVRPLNTNFYLQKPLVAPSSWDNNGKGGIDIGIKGKSMLANNYSGARLMKKGDTLYYNFKLLITPFHTLNTDAQWAMRFYHKYDDPRIIRATGATVVNIHHATPINPWINYPFIEWKKMKGFIDTAHSLGLKVKIYNTVRELSDHAYEIFALRSLGHEIYPAGPGKGFSWLQEHLGDDYIPAWFVPEIKDAAIINSGTDGGGRWHNYYVEGMNWLVRNVGIDGIYLDDVAFDRVTMKRIKRVLTQDGHPGIIDLHSANQYNPRDGYNNSANLYMEHFPYLNRLWFGEYFDYENNPPDFFLTEVSGIPFGLMGEMLQGGGNPWRGMVYGMTNRMPWSDNADPRPIWKAWDDFGMQGTKMIGYWSPACPVKTGVREIPATVYKKRDAVLVALASWASQDTTVRLAIDWQSIGIDPAHATIEAPEIKNFQPARHFAVGDPLPVEKGKGWLLVIR